VQNLGYFQLAKIFEVALSENQKNFFPILEIIVNAS